MKMKAKLIKDSDGYWLDISNDVITKRPLTDFGQLSIKNCEAIERGYDLFELAEKEAKKIHDWNKHKYSEVFYNKLVRKDGEFIKIGFKKALEILGDKTFTEEDVRKAFESGYETLESDRTYNEHYEEMIQSLQQTEWDVEIIMSEVVTDDEVGMAGIPKLDSDGCLILRRI